MKTSKISRKHRFDLFLSVRKSMKGLAALRNLQTACEKLFPGNYEIAVTYLSESPNIKEERNIFVSPLVEFEKEGIIYRLTGDLIDAEKELMMLKRA